MTVCNDLLKPSIPQSCWFTLQFCTWNDGQCNLNSTTSRYAWEGVSHVKRKQTLRWCLEAQFSALTVAAECWHEVRLPDSELVPWLCMWKDWRSCALLLRTVHVSVLWSNVDSTQDEQMLRLRFAQYPISSLYLRRCNANATKYICCAVSARAICITLS